MYYTSMIYTLQYIILHKHATYFEIYLDMKVTIKVLSNDASSVNKYKNMKTLQINTCVQYSRFSQVRQNPKLFASDGSTVYPLCRVWCIIIYYIAMLSLVYYYTLHSLRFKWYNY